MQTHSHYPIKSVEDGVSLIRLRKRCKVDHQPSLEHLQYTRQLTARTGHHESAEGCKTEATTHEIPQRAKCRYACFFAALHDL